MYVIYEQFQKSRIIVFFTYIIIAFLLLFIIIRSGLPNTTSIVLFFVFLFDIYLFICFYKLTFKITSEGIEFGFGIFKRKIKKDKIQSIFIDNSVSIFIGYGIRFGKNKTLGFIARVGDGLTIKTKYGLVFFVSLDDPKTALDIIKQNNYV
ncbi:MAG: hypothetical protein PHZ07_04595 [Patescibacteria group bacterium]|nr:hypothetical protein [Patescibacteria group bacterium]MDD4304586.1 hypothetical protein [Patescibacteria group bacterium]MDD4695621.1 hypothetical protein [Patescibacteria group bacterium]